MATKKWMVRNLRDLHVSEDAQYGNKFTENLIGLLCFPGHLPQLVSCGPVNYDNVLNINHVREDAENMYLTTRSASLVNRDQLRKLKLEGKILLDTIQGDPTLTLLEEVP